MPLTTTPEPLPRVARWAVFGAFVAMTVLAVHLAESGSAAVLWASAAVAVGFAAGAVLGPPRWAALPAAGAVAAVVVICGTNPSNGGWFASLIIAGWCVLATRLLDALLLSAGVLIVFALELAVFSDEQSWLPWLAGTVFSTVACVFARRLADVVAELHATQADLADRVQAEERARIARELHDVIAHSLTVSLLHVSSARLAVADDPADAERALAEAERLGRAALDEVRHAVGTLRTAEGTDPRAPLPGSTDVPALIAGFTSAGADVRASVDADLSSLPATVGLATYRILQEALTNAVKHAPERRATVSLRADAAVVRLDVDSAGTPGSGRGHGLVGMRERAESVGGHCEAGPGGSGWLVHAELPIGTPDV